MNAEQQQQTVESLQRIIKESQAALAAFNVHPPDATIREGQLQSDLSSLGKILKDISDYVGYKGTPRELLGFIKTRIKPA